MCLSLLILACLELLIGILHQHLKTQDWYGEVTGHFWFGIRDWGVYPDPNSHEYQEKSRDDVPNQSMKGIRGVFSLLVTANTAQP